MKAEEIKILAKKRGVTCGTVHRWVRELGDEGARNYLPVCSASAKGIKSRVNSPWGGGFRLPGSPKWRNRNGPT